jgi:hypothetical protein
VIITKLDRRMVSELNFMRELLEGAAGTPCSGLSYFSIVEQLRRLPLPANRNTGDQLGG